MDAFAIVLEDRRLSSARFHDGNRPQTAAGPIDDILARLRQERKENHFQSRHLSPWLGPEGGLRRPRKLSKVGFDGAEGSFHSDDSFLDILPVERKRRNLPWEKTQERDYRRDERPRIAGSSRPITAPHRHIALLAHGRTAAQSPESRPLKSVTFDSVDEVMNETERRNSLGKFAPGLNSPLRSMAEYGNGGEKFNSQGSGPRGKELVRGGTASYVKADKDIRSRPWTALGNESESKRAFITDQLREERRLLRTRRRRRPDDEQKARLSLSLSQKGKVGAVALTLPPTDEEMKQSFRVRDERLEVTKQRRRDAESDQRRRLIDAMERREQLRLERETEKKVRAERGMEALRVVTLAATLAPWMSSVVPAEIERFRRKRALDEAATRIQAFWRRGYFARKVDEARDVSQKLTKFGWRLRIWSRCTRRRLHAMLLRSFFEDFSFQQLNYIMHTFRHRVTKAQKLVRNFIECKRARIHVLERHWKKLERDIVHKKRGSRKRRKNALIKDQSKVKQEKPSKWAKIQCLSSAASSRMDASGHSLVRTICRYHLEDERKIHLARCAAMVEEGDESGPLVNQNHARLLLAGKPISVDYSKVRKRCHPPFRLFNEGGRRRLRRIMEVLLQDKDAVKAHMERRLRRDIDAMLSYRYVADSNTCEENGKDCEDASNSPGGAGADADASCERKRGSVETAASRIVDENRALAQRHSVSENEVHELREIFQLVDLDGGGTIDREELGKLLDLLGIQKAEDEIIDMMSAIDETGTCEVNFMDFVRSLKADLPKPVYTEKSVLAAFGSFARGMPEGMIRNDQLFHALMSFKGRLSATTARAAMCDAGLDESVIDYHQFVTIMFQSSA